jgi:hypothetical protein
MLSIRVAREARTLLLVASMDPQTVHILAE